MIKRLACLLVCFLVLSRADEELHKSRVHDHDFTEEEHFPDGEHNPTYDQEAFAGEESKEFKDLTPEQSKTKLRALVEAKVDKDHNGKVTSAELTAWISKSMKKYVHEDVDQQWENVNADKDSAITWKEYKNSTYGYMDGASEDDETYKSIIERDHRRFQRADKNGDAQLTKDEFLYFLHPEESEDMKGIVVEETMEDLDKDKDGFLSLEEYIGDIPKEEDGSEPDWVKSEREQFNTYRDTNKDGKLDKEEVGKWVVPPEDNHAEQETTHLFEQADADKDGELSVDEMVDRYEAFVGSQATNYGAQLHEEL